LHNSLNYNYKKIYKKKIDKKCLAEINNTEYNSDRCFVSIPVNIDGNEILISTAHLCGGKYADEKAFDNDAAYNERKNEMEKIINYFDNQKNTNKHIIFGADFNSIRKNLYNETMIPEYLLNKISNKTIINNYMTSPHDILDKQKFKTLIPNNKDLGTSDFKTVIDYIYYRNPNEEDIKIQALESTIIETLDVSYHNAIITKFRVNESKQIIEHHKKFKEDFLYKKTFESIKENYDIFKKYIPNHIKYNCTDKIGARKIYNKFFVNILNNPPLKNTLDKTFKKKFIPKGTLFYHTFDFYSNFSSFLNGENFDENEVLNKLNVENNKLKKFNDTNTKKDDLKDLKSEFKDVYKFFINEHRNSGSIYTTSCQNKDDITDCMICPF
jgi:hypothetical protein